MRKNAFLKFDISFFLMFFVALFLDELKLCVLFCVFTFLHEMAHFFVAKQLGYFPKKIHLTFFGASLEGVDDFLISDEIKIVLAGPVLNLSLVVFCYLLFWFFPESHCFLDDVLLANWSIFLFNFLPIYPLDFGRIILAMFSKKYARKEALLKTKKVSILFLIFMFCVFVLSMFFVYNFSLGFVCVNLTSLMFSASKDTSYKRQVFVFKKFEKLKKGVHERKVYVAADTPLYALFKHIDDFHFLKFVFLDESYRQVKEMSEVEFYREMGLL